LLEHNIAKAAVALTSLVLLEDGDNLVNELDRGTTLALRLAHDLGVAALVLLD